MAAGGVHRSTSDAPDDLATARVVVSLELRPSGASSNNGTDRCGGGASGIVERALSCDINGLELPDVGCRREAPVD